MVRYDLAVATNYPVAPMTGDKVDPTPLTNRQMASRAVAEAKYGKRSDDYRHGYANGYASGVAAAKRREKSHDVGPDDYLDYDPEPYERELRAEWIKNGWIKSGK